MSLTIDEHSEGGWTVLCVRGELDFCTAPQLRSALSASLSRFVELVVHPTEGASSQSTTVPRGLVVDLSMVSFMDSAGLGALVGAHQHATADRTRLRLAGSSDRVMELLVITGLDRVLALHPSLSEACSATLVPAAR